MDEVRLQQDYYTRTAGSYDALHLTNTAEPEHDIALNKVEASAN